MYKYTVKRVLLMIPTLLGAAFVVFTLLRLIPGDVCELRLAGEGAYVDEAAILQCQESLGINDPWIVQFGNFVKGFIIFDLGESMWTNRAITTEIASTSPHHVDAMH